MLELAFRADRGGREPVYRQLAGYLRELIRTRRLAAGERLPASRELAASLLLSRNTVSQAYQSLLDDGLLRAHVGQGTFVTGRAPELAATAEPAAPPAFAWEGLLARRTRQLPLPSGVAEPDPIRFDFRGGRADVDSLPVADLKRAFSRAAARAKELADVVDPRGWPPLRRAIARQLVARGIDCRAHEVAIVDGAQQALDLVARALVDPGDTVALEQPGYFGAALAFSACEAHLVGVSVDADGLKTDELARLLRARRVKLLYTTPAVQHPTGVSLSDARRRALLALADEYQLPIVEDDYDSELRYGGPPVPALKNLDRAGRVIYAGTFSKALFPGLRVGYLVAPIPVLARIAIARFGADLGGDLVTQLALADLIETGALERHVRRLRRLHAARLSALDEALKRHMPPGTSFRRPAGGHTLWLRLPDAADADAVGRLALAAGIALGRGESFAVLPGPARAEAERHVSLAFARIPEAGMDEAVRALAEVVRRACGGRRARRKVA